MAFFSKNSVVINFFAKTSSSKNRGYFHNFFGKNIFRIILSVHGLSSMQVSFRRKVIINANNSDHSSIVFNRLREISLTGTNFFSQKFAKIIILD
jgi:hypothetical protein